MAQTVAEEIILTQGQTQPVEFQLVKAPKSPKDLTGATVKLSLFDIDGRDEEWDFDDAKASVSLTTASEGKCKWTPVDDKTVPDPGRRYAAQLRITYSGGEIEYFPRDRDVWIWTVKFRTTD